jgi:multiple sugar transport system ATP-binding protein
MASVTLRDIKKSYGATHVIKGVSMDIQDGEFIVFVGPSGCGKSTLLRMIAGLEEITAGDLDFDSKRVNDMAPKEREIAMVFQSYALYPHKTVFENMAFGLRLAKTPDSEIQKKVAGAAASLKMEHLLERRPNQLSGGQRQRVAIGRAIVREPKVFLFDEPLSNLDAALRTQMRVELAELHQRLGATMIYVTHDQVEAMTMADRIAVLNGGIVEQMGAPMDLYNNPASLFVASFIGSPKMNLIEGMLAQRYGAHTVGMRPEHIAVDAKKGDIEATVRLVEQLGSDTFAYVNAEQAGSMTVRLVGQHSLAQGAKVFLTPDPATIHRFGSDGKPIKG